MRWALSFFAWSSGETAPRDFLEDCLGLEPELLLLASVPLSRPSVLFGVTKLLSEGVSDPCSANIPLLLLLLLLL